MRAAAPDRRPAAASGRPPRQLDHEAGTTAGPVLHPDPPVVGGDLLGDEGQAEADAAPHVPASTRPAAEAVEDALPVLRRDEGWALRAYKDTLGNLTIGCGHNLAVPITNTAVLQILRDDVDTVREQLEHYRWFCGLDTVRQGALINLGFMGVAKILGFTRMIDALWREDWTAAARELLDSTYAQQVGARARRLAAQLETGEWQ